MARWLSWQFSSAPLLSLGGHMDSGWGLMSHMLDCIWWSQIESVYAHGVLISWISWFINQVEEDKSEGKEDVTIDCPLCHTKVSLMDGKVVVWCPKDGPMQWFIGTLKEKAPAVPAKVWSCLPWRVLLMGLCKGSVLRLNNTTFNRCTLWSLFTLSVRS